ncbi:hypothetical protein CAPTEDRAFT_200879 [Capitella teleta]|uniref:Uncharacterized protein n=1 Tax=Capitella teleta TaxID=283909 RepID=R7URK5_CAPTE|nr:hypothetical protein CAPTEDRAFT_200879 [Capitella teleta]|eukprot:ELU08840.1 hypothetical protein CAPTEDRAFT_200879 [Capitella teleta]
MSTVLGMLWTFTILALPPCYVYFLVNWVPRQTSHHRQFTIGLLNARSAKQNDQNADKFQEIHDLARSRHACDYQVLGVGIAYDLPNESREVGNRCFIFAMLGHFTKQNCQYCACAFNSG